MGLFNFLKKEKITILGIEFPMFNEGIKTWTESKKTKKYERKDYYYLKYEPEKICNYFPIISTYGFKAISNKKFIKGNSYIIVENYNNHLHIAFQVNK